MALGIINKKISISIKFPDGMRIAKRKYDMPMAAQPHEPRGRDDKVFYFLTGGFLGVYCKGDAREAEGTSKGHAIAGQV